MGIREYLLMEILECSRSDLAIIDGFNYDLGEIVDDLKRNGLEITLYTITDKVFLMVQSELRDVIKDAIKEREERKHETDTTEEGEKERCKIQKEIDELRRLNPLEDMKWVCDYTDISCRLSDCDGIYRKYLAVDIENLESDMGFKFNEAR